ncbi:MAG: ribonucleoside triphosphate reductase, partial [Oscillospiraceae bacterium]|nr:ribonucleoside triphosphate reductase [Oscillospiraceae bacterium]
AKDEKDFYARLDKMMDIAARSLKTKREVITQLMNNGLYPYTKRYLDTFANHFSTIGLIGMNEVGLNAKWLRADLTHEATQQFAKEVLDYMRNRLSDYQEQYGDLYNLEATPAESTTYRFAKHDKELYPDIITANEHGKPYYTNSSHLPVGYTEDIFSALEVQDELQTRYTSGTVFHAFLGEKLPDWKSAANLVRKIAENFKLPYYTMSPTYSVCAEHGYLTGEQFTCPICGKTTEVYSRITGYYRPVQNWNDGKSQEYKDRQVYDIGNSVLRGGVNAVKSAEECVCAAEEPAPAAAPAPKAESTASAKAILFSRITCPNCRVAEGLLAKANVEFEKLIADQDLDMCRKYGIKGAPTLVITDGDTYQSYYSVPEIKKYLASL